MFIPDVFDWLEKDQKGAGGEILLTDAIEKQTAQDKVFACRYDCGSKLGLLQASADVGDNPSGFGEEFAEWLKHREGVGHADLLQAPSFMY